MNGRSIRLLIVDDEEEIREGISQTIPWEKYQISLVGQAANGQEALNLIRDTRPDIMLLDIKMPVVNGLDVLERLSQFAPKPQVIILSGYDDFSYCQNALKKGAVDYLLKPCHPREIIDIVTKIRDDILTKEEENQRLEKLRKQFRENLDLLREKLVIYLARTENPDVKIGSEKWRLYEMGIAPENIGIALIRIDRHGYRESLELEKLAVRNRVQEILNVDPAIPCFLCDHDDDLLILWEYNPGYEENFHSRLEELRRSIEENFTFTVTVGLGTVVSSFAELYHGYNSALLALEHSFWLGTNRVIDYCQVEPEEEEAVNFPSTEEEAILYCIRTNNNEQIEAAVNSFFKAVAGSGEGYGKTGKDCLLKLVTALFCSVFHVCVERGLNTEEVFGSDLSILDELSRMETIDDLRQKVIAIFKKILSLSSVHKSSWKVVAKALQFMDEHYMEDLRLETVAQNVYVSPGYLSALFTRELQKNFVCCLHEIRISKAKILLRNEHIKIYEVATSVGYNSEKYFSQIFKKLVGMTPNQYRETLKFN